MTKLAVCTETCLSCHDSRFCLVRWGTECKRQGGKKIPRMKSVPLHPARKVEKPIQKKTEKPRPIIFNLFEPISTKATNWI